MVYCFAIKIFLHFSPEVVRYPPLVEAATQNNESFFEILSRNARQSVNFFK
jgi:hypothetical protein